MFNLGAYLCTLIIAGYTLYIDLCTRVVPCVHKNSAPSPMGWDELTPTLTVIVLFYISVKSDGPVEK